MTSYVRKLIEQDLTNAEDNLYRAKFTAKRNNPTAQYGESRKTLNQNIKGYEDWIEEAKLNLPTIASR